MPADLPVEPAPMAASSTRCPWCSTPAAPDATRCPACGAALAQRESLGGLVIPGVTSVDPALPAEHSLAHPILGAQGTVRALETIGLISTRLELAAAAAVNAGDEVRHLVRPEEDLEAVGRPSEAVLMALDRLEHETDGPPGAPDTARDALPDETLARPREVDRTWEGIDRDDLIG